MDSRVTPALPGKQQGSQDALTRPKAARPQHGGASGALQPCPRAWGSPGDSPADSPRGGPARPQEKRGAPHLQPHRQLLLHRGWGRAAARTEQAAPILTDQRARRPHEFCTEPVQIGAIL